MDKEQAIAAMNMGKKVAHRYFTDNEWMMMVGGRYTFEDGCVCDPSEFWAWRTDDSWDSGWRVVD